MKKSLAICCILLLNILFGFLFVSCPPIDLVQASITGVPWEGSDAKEVTSFVFTATNNAGLSADVTGTISGNVINAGVPTGTDVTALVPTIAVSASASVNPANGTAQDFSSAVSYTVTAEDGTTQDYAVTAEIEESDAKEITSFVFTAANNAGLSADVTGTISGNAINAGVPTGTDVTALVPTITVSASASVSPASGAAQDFSSDVSYTVTAENNTTQEYAATVTVDDDDVGVWNISNWNECVWGN